MDSKNEMIEENQSLNILIADSVELIQYARQITAKQVNLVQLKNPRQCLRNWIRNNLLLFHGHIICSLCGLKMRMNENFMK